MPYEVDLVQIRHVVGNLTNSTDPAQSLTIVIVTLSILLVYSQAQSEILLNAKNNLN